MIEVIEARLRAVAILGSLGDAVDLDTVLHYTRLAAQSVSDGAAGYHLLVARKP